jgi:hypothetical protein
MRLLLLFLDGVGLGPNNTDHNPFARAPMPALQGLLGGHRLVENHSAPVESERATLLPLDACLGVAGRPQSASGQAALLTGQNVPAQLGSHYGPKPNAAITDLLRVNGTLFSELAQAGKHAGLLNAYPERYFEALQSGQRLPGVVALAAMQAGLRLKNTQDLLAGRALSADFSGQGWHEHLGRRDIPLLTPAQAGQRLSGLAESYDFAFFEYWLSDVAGHQQDLDSACALLETFDQVLAGLLESWQDGEGLILICSDHGNLEDLRVRQHTLNPVPALAIGDPHKRRELMRGWRNLTDIAPAICRLLI